jgi:hypothetical protein
MLNNILKKCFLIIRTAWTENDMLIKWPLTNILIPIKFLFLFYPFFFLLMNSMANAEKQFTCILCLHGVDLLQFHWWLGYYGHIYCNEHHWFIMCFNYEINSLRGINSLTLQYSSFRFNNIMNPSLCISAYYSFLLIPRSFLLLSKKWLALLLFVSLLWCCLELCHLVSLFLYKQSYVVLSK